MQVGKLFLITVSIVLLPTIILGQTHLDTSQCYIDSFKSDESVFTKIQINASFKGGAIKFQDFLIKNIDHSKFITTLSTARPSYTDTARVKFIISKNGGMSNMEISGTQNDSFRSEIEKVMKQSSCFWEPGNYSGRNVNGWYQYDIFYFVELKGGDLKIRVNFKWYDYVDKQST